MPKNLLQDMVRVEPKRKKAVPVSSPDQKIETTAFKFKQKADREEIFFTKKHVSPEKVKPREVEVSGEIFQDKSPRRHEYALWVVAAFSVLFLFFALSYFFSWASVTVTPKSKEVALNQNLTATKDPLGETLPFDVVVVSGEENRTPMAQGEKEVATKAKGTVMIYNDFSNLSQRLDINTRLESSEGKIYKTDKAVVVPGQSGGKPGSVEVTVAGAEAGVEYNSDPEDFKIFGFKGTPKYNKFYARSKGPLSGGFVGRAPSISDEEKLTLQNDMTGILKEKLFTKTKDQIPSGFVLFKGATFVEMEALNIDPAIKPDGTTKATLKGTLYGILFDEAKLTQEIVEKNIDKYDGSEVFIPNIETINFALQMGEIDPVSLVHTDSITFNLSGKPNVIWKTDSERLTTDLLGKAKKDFNDILLQYPNIEKAELSLRPFWRRSLPDKIKDIKVSVLYPEVTQDPN